MNKQETFDFVVAHLIKQNAPCLTDQGIKAYAFAGRYSAIGCYLKAWHPAYLDEVAGYPEDIALNLEVRDLLLALENVHDYHTPDWWHAQFHAVAKEFGLIYKGIHYGDQNTQKQATTAPVTIEYTCSLDFKVRLPEGAPLTDEELQRAAIVSSALGKGRPPMTQQVIVKETRRVERAPYALSIDVRLPNGAEWVTMVGVMAYDEYDAADVLRESLGHPDESDLSIIKVAAVQPEAFNFLQRIDV